MIFETSAFVNAVVVVPSGCSTAYQYSHSETYLILHGKIGTLEFRDQRAEDLGERWLDPWALPRTVEVLQHTQRPLDFAAVLS